MKPYRVPFWIHHFRSTHRRLQANLCSFTNFQMTRSSENTSENIPSPAFTQWRRLVESPFPYNRSRKLYSRKICSKGLSWVSKCVFITFHHHIFTYPPLITLSHSPNNAIVQIIVSWQTEILFIDSLKYIFWKRRTSNPHKFRLSEKENPSFKCWKEPKPPQIAYKIFNMHLLHGLISNLKTLMKRANLEWIFNIYIE